MGPRAVLRIGDSAKHGRLLKQLDIEATRDRASVNRPSPYPHLNIRPLCGIWARVRGAEARCSSCSI
jgi:hypothetical protein